MKDIRKMIENLDKQIEFNKKRGLGFWIEKVTDVARCNYNDEFDKIKTLEIYMERIRYYKEEIEILESQRDMLLSVLDDEEDEDGE